MDVGLWRYRLARLRSRFWDLPGTWVLAEVWDRGTYPVRRALCRADRWHDVGCRGVTCCPEFQRLVRGARVAPATATTKHPTPPEEQR